MSANLVQTNGYYNVSCNQIFEKQNAFALCSNVPNAQTVVPGTPQLISYNGAPSAIFEGITFNADKTIFTISSVGVYAVQAEISVDLPATAGCQASLELVINGLTNNGFDVAYANPTTAIGSVKLTIKSFISSVSGAPQTISLRASTLVGSVQYRYANLAIFKIASI
jgi:hypothetical protein